MSNVFQLYQLGDDFVEFTDRSGRKWRLSPLTVAQRSRLQSRIRDKTTDPMQLYHDVRRAEPAHVAAELFKVACKERAFWPPPVEASLMLISETPELRCEFLREMLLKHQPDVTAEQATEVGDQLTSIAFVQLFSYAVTGLRPDDPNLSRAAQDQQAPTGSN